MFIKTIEDQMEFLQNKIAEMRNEKDDEITETDKERETDEEIRDREIYADSVRDAMDDNK